MIEGSVSSADASGTGFLDRAGTLITIKRGQPLFREGERADCCFKVVSGAVRGCRHSTDGRRQIGNFFLDGDFIAFDAGAFYSFTAESITDTRLIRYARRKLDALVAREPQVAISVLDTMQQGLLAMRERMAWLGHMSAMERVASFLLALADRGDQALVNLPMTRTDIADHLGLTIGTLSRARSQLTHEGIIAQRGAHAVMIEDRNALEDLAEMSEARAALERG